MTMYNTLLLDQVYWDLVIDSLDNIAMASPPYSLSQDVASAIKLYLGELWYNTSKGVPYFEEILGKSPPYSLVASRLEEAAMTVSGVVKAKCRISDPSDRYIYGDVWFLDENGKENVINL